MPGTPPSRAVLRVEAEGTFLFSDATLSELGEVLARPKFDIYLSRSIRDRYLSSIIRISERVLVTRNVSVCRDPRDDRVLEVAVNGNADVVVTGVRDLLVIGRFEGIPIVPPVAFSAGR